MSAGLEPVQYPDQVRCDWIAQADEECDAEKMREWVYDLLSPAQARHTSSLFRWKLVVRQTDLTASTKAVAFLIAERTDPKDRTKCYPSVATIAANVSCSERTVLRATAELGRRGFLMIYRRRKGALRNDSNLYVPAWPEFYVWKSDDQVTDQVTPCPDQVTPCPDQVTRPSDSVSGEVVTEVVTEEVNKEVTKAREFAELRSDAFAHASGDPERSAQGQGQGTAGGGQETARQGSSRPQSKFERPRRASPSPKGQGPAPRKCPECGDPYIVDEHLRNVPSCSHPAVSS
jgi:Helix-turn-helix domain